MIWTLPSLASAVGVIAASREFVKRNAGENEKSWIRWATITVASTFLMSYVIAKMSGESVSLPPSKHQSMRDFTAFFMAVFVSYAASEVAESYEWEDVAASVTVGVLTSVSFIIIRKYLHSTEIFL